MNVRRSEGEKKTITCDTGAIVHWGPVLFTDQIQFGIWQRLQSQVDLLAILQTLTDPVEVA